MASVKMTEMMDEIATPDVKPLDRNEVEGVLRAMRQVRYQANTEMPKRQGGGFKKRSLAELAMAAQSNAEGMAAPEEKMALDTDAQPDRAGQAATGTADNRPQPDKAPQALDMADAPSSGDGAPKSEADEWAEKLAEAREAGIAEGKALAQSEALAAAEAEAFQNIEARARQLQEAQKDELVGRLEQLAQALMSPMALNADALAASLEAAVERLAYARIGQAIGEMPEIFINRITDLVAQVRQQNETAHISLNETDYELIVPLLEQRPAFAKCTFERNSNLEHGDIRIVFGAISFEDILADRLGHGESETALVAAPEMADMPETVQEEAAEESDATQLSAASADEAAADNPEDETPQ
ncbi:MAG: FliH/SctL family protein [Parvibaculales bacterium]